MSKYLSNGGFTLIELVIVMAIVSIMGVIALPKISGMLGDSREDSVLFKSYIEAVTDDSFIRKKTNYLCIHLSKPGKEEENPLYDIETDVNNGLNVFEIIDGKFVKNKSNILKERKFGSAFVIEEVLLNGGKSINEGDVLIPFYSDGTSEDFQVTVKLDSGIVHFNKGRTGRGVRSDNENSQLL